MLLNFLCISCGSFPVSHFNASPRKGNRLLFDHGFSESVLSNYTADFMVGLYDSYMLSMCHGAEGDWVLPNLYLLASISTDKVWQSLLLGTPISVAWHINLMITQAKKVDKNNF